MRHLLEYDIKWSEQAVEFAKLIYFFRGKIGIFGDETDIHFVA